MVSKTEEVHIMDEFIVHISYKYIRYTEYTHTIELDVEPSKDKLFVYIPTEKSWNNSFGEWASGRRNIILERIKSKIKDVEYFEFQDVDIHDKDF